MLRLTTGKVKTASPLFYSTLARGCREDQDEIKEIKISIQKKKPKFEMINAVMNFIDRVETSRLPKEKRNTMIIIYILLMISYTYLYNIIA